MEHIVKQEPVDYAGKALIRAAEPSDRRSTTDSLRSVPARALMNFSTAP